MPGILDLIGALTGASDTSGGISTTPEGKYSYTPMRVGKPRADAVLSGGKGADKADAYNAAVGAALMQQQLANEARMNEVNAVSANRIKEVKELTYTQILAKLGLPDNAENRAKYEPIAWEIAQKQLQADAQLAGGEDYIAGQKAAMRRPEIDARAAAQVNVPGGSMVMTAPDLRKPASNPLFGPTFEETSTVEGGTTLPNGMNFGGKPVVTRKQVMHIPRPASLRTDTAFGAPVTPTPTEGFTPPQGTLGDVLANQGTKFVTGMQQPPAINTQPDGIMSKIMNNPVGRFYGDTGKTMYKAAKSIPDPLELLWGLLTTMGRKNINDRRKPESK